MKAFLLLLVLFQIWPGDIAHAQDCTEILRGSVVSEDGWPLAGATVVAGNKKGVITGPDGSFEIEPLCAGRWRVEIRFVGFQPKSVEVMVPTVAQRFILTPELTQLQEVVVQASPQSATLATSTLTGKSLEAEAGKSLGAALQEVTGVTSLQSGPAIFKPVIHGVHSQRILILNNGIRLEGQQWGAEHAPEIDPFVAGSITVIKDASAIKYGTDALGGVILITPAALPEQRSWGGNLYTAYQSNGRGGVVSGVLEGGAANGWGWRIQGTARQVGDSRAPDYYLTNTGFREGNFSASLGQHRPSWGWEVFYSRFRTTIGILAGSSIGSAASLATALEREPPQRTAPDFSYNIGEPRQEVEHQLLKLNAHVERDRHTLQLQYGLQINKREEYDFRRGALRNIPALAYDLYSHTVDLFWESKHPARLNRFTCRGVNLMLQDNRKVDGTQTLPFIPNFIHGSAGIFWIEQGQWGRLFWEGGLRYDARFYDVAGFDFRNRLYKTQLSFHNVSGLLAVARHFSAHSAIKTSWATTWRPPNVAELYSLGVHQSVASIEYGLLLDEQTSEVNSLKGSGVRSEQGFKWITTWQWNPGRFSLETSAYANLIAHYIYLRPQGVTTSLRGVYPYFRYDQTHASFIGWDVDVRGQFHPHWSAGVKASFLRAFDESRKEFLLFIPGQRLTASVRYERPVGPGTLFTEARAGVRFRQALHPRVITVRDILDATEQGEPVIDENTGNFDFTEAPNGYAVVGGQAGYRLALKGQVLTFRITGDNLLNTSFREYTNRMRYFSDDVGRNLTFSVRYAF